jgi:hypothetical protein
MALQVQASATGIRVSSTVYAWEWERERDIFSLYDGKERLIGSGVHQPFVLTSDANSAPQAGSSSYRIDHDRVSILYEGVNGDSALTVTWSFRDDFIRLEPLRYESSCAEEIVQIVYFPKDAGVSYRPSFYSRYAVVPGLSMSTNISPVVDLHSRLSVVAALGSGAMRGPGFSQQWGLPAHYFCVFNTAERWNAVGARQLQSGAACCGLAELPDGDFRLHIAEIGLSPVLNLRGDLWKQFETPGKLQLGCSFLIAFGEQFYDAIRSYYRILQREGVIKSKSVSAKKSEVLLAPQFNTWGMQSARALHPENLTEAIVLDTFEKLRRSAMKARTFVIDDKWEGRYGELKHDPVRFPNFPYMLESIRESGYSIGLWAAFLRCEDPAALGLRESNLLQKQDGTPLWLTHGAARYGIFDVTQTAVQVVLRARAREFVRLYRPDLIKFDFGYELPSLDVAAPADTKWGGERLLQKGLEVIVGAMKEENPDLVIMYYGLSPLLVDYYDLHSPDDLVYCGGDYDLETNRRIFFSSLCGELGMPTYGSSGYDWASATSIWFDSAPSGTLGSLHCFDGDENGDLPTHEQIAKYNGLSAILRRGTTFQVYPLAVSWQGGLRAAFAPSWERVEDGKTVLLALRTHRFDGKPAIRSYKDVLDTDVMLVVASLTEEDIARAARLGIVPFGGGACTIRRVGECRSVKLIEHYFDGSSWETRIPCQEDVIELSLWQTREGHILEWLEVVFAEESGGDEFALFPSAEH